MRLLASNQSTSLLTNIQSQYPQKEGGSHPCHTSPLPSNTETPLLSNTGTPLPSVMELPSAQCSPQSVAWLFSAPGSQSLSPVTGLQQFPVVKQQVTESVL